MAMTGTITQIMPERPGRGGRRFRRVQFRLDNGKTAFCDLVPAFRNYKGWKSLLVVGNVLSGLSMLSADKVNGDSKPQFIGKEDPAAKKPDENQMSLL